jgi:PAS domain S-box-containing protein
MYVSPVVKKILGYKPEEMIGRTIFDLMDQDDSQEFRETLKEIGRSKKPFNNLERITVHKAGNKIILETNGTPILDAAGNLEGFRGSDRDITERKRAEKALQQYAVDLEEARNNLEIKVNERTKELQIAHESLMRREKLAVLGELSSSVSHELRNPLGVIRNAIYFLNMKLSEDEDDSIRDNLKIISKEINTANKIITDLLDFTRDKSPVTLEVDVNQLAREMLSKTVMPDNINIVTDFNEELKPISVDPTQVAQVFINLIENGIGAMENGGTLTVSTRTNNNHAVEAVFTDTGCGIPEENMDRIFEPLFTTKAKGIGLGLVVSKKMAEANGGTLHVESEEGSGSIFTVSFFKRSKL